MYNISKFGETVVKQRRKKGITQEELAANLSITPQAVSKWENGIGFPDVTLFPKIAEFLEIPIEKLFGISNSAHKASFPSNYEGLSFVCAEKSTTCYSDKQVIKAENGICVFADGSTADLSSGTVTNTGAGEIRLLQGEQGEFGTSDINPDKTSYEEKFPGIESMSFSISHFCKLIVHKGADGECRISAAGTPTFISLIEAAASERTLNVNVKSINNYRGDHIANLLEVFAGFPVGKDLKISISGSSDAKVEPDFQNTVFKISGSGDIVCAGAGNFEVAISGSGDVSCASSNDAKIQISGSGDVSLGQSHGNLSIKISGSGAVENSGGEVGLLSLSIAGSGSLSAKELTVREANIRINGSGDVTIGRIVEKSVEKLSRGSSLTVLKRG